MVRQLSSALLAAAVLLAGAASAQAPKGAQPLPDVPPPPKLSDKPAPADDEEANSVTVRQDGDTKIEEFRTKAGRVYAVRVTPRVGKPYMMFSPDGSDVPSGEPNGGVRPAQWTIFEF
jgi:hypothetical protein